ncbi:MAG: hypothetical protein RJQ14_01160 [Marinoscillum sp.]
MPANRKYLSRSFQRGVKISAGFVGGYFVTISFFLTLSLWLDRAGTMVTLIFGGFILWAGLMVCAFLFKNGWFAWLTYLIISGVFSMIFYSYQFVL